MKTEPHERGGLRVIVEESKDLDSERGANEVPLIPVAEEIAEFYKLCLCGNPNGQLGVMGGLMPERLLWTQVHAACRATGTKMNLWAGHLLFLIDGIRLRFEFERFNAANKKDPPKQPRKR
jgi:hypothetical protein